MASPVDVIEGKGPVILCQPHSGTFVPEEIAAALNETGRALADTDWHVDRLYDGLLEGVTIVRARFHRYVIDANRPPSGATLYPGQNTTGLCPLTDFDGAPIYNVGEEPGDAEIARRRAAFHAPYHAAIAAQIGRVKNLHGVAVLYDCHSIRSRIPFLFEGELPVFNIGTNGGATCDARFARMAVKVCAEAARADDYAWVANGRFKGGWTTRCYGDPANNVHAIQMELAQRAYMIETPPWNYNEQAALRLRRWLGDILAALDSLAHDGALQ